jgi:hypothetical protein
MVTCPTVPSARDIAREAADIGALRDVRNEGDLLERFLLVGEDIQRMDRYRARFSSTASPARARS